jgi:hypothetical protein
MGWATSVTRGWADCSTLREPSHGETLPAERDQGVASDSRTRVLARLAGRLCDVGERRVAQDTQGIESAVNGLRVFV